MLAQLSCEALRGMLHCQCGIAQACLFVHPGNSVA